MLEQPSPPTSLASSHCSPLSESTRALPQYSNWQVSEQPSPETALPSSHCSLAAWIRPSPQTSHDTASAPSSSVQPQTLPNSKSSKKRQDGSAVSSEQTAGATAPTAYTGSAESIDIAASSNGSKSARAKASLETRRCW